jgi:hypothetical protein
MLEILDRAVILLATPTRKGGDGHSIVVAELGGEIIPAGRPWFDVPHAFIVRGACRLSTLLSADE